MGTLQCYYRHQVHDDPILLPGLQDITAHVDFTAIAEAAEFSGFDIEGYTTQSFFLADNNMSQFIKQLHQEEGIDVTKMQGIRKMLLPSGMGEVFKVMALSKHYDGGVTGFDACDFTHLL